MRVVKPGDGRRCRQGRSLHDRWHQPATIEARPSACRGRDSPSIHPRVGLVDGLLTERARTGRLDSGGLSGEVFRTLSADLRAWCYRIQSDKKFASSPRKKFGRGSPLAGRCGWVRAGRLALGGFRSLPLPGARNGIRGWWAECRRWSLLAHPFRMQERQRNSRTTANSVSGTLKGLATRETPYGLVLTGRITSLT